jgi:hypothetical protein
MTYVTAWITCSRILLCSRFLRDFCRSWRPACGAILLDLRECESRNRAKALLWAQVDRTLDQPVAVSRINSHCFGQVNCGAVPVREARAVWREILPTVTKPQCSCLRATKASASNITVVVLPVERFCSRSDLSRQALEFNSHRTEQAQHLLQNSDNYCSCICETMRVQ